MILYEETKLSVLDFGDSNSPEENVHDVFKYAVLAEQLGFKRFWMGEHYIKNTVFSNPEPLIPVIAMMTKSISVGTAGLLIRQHSVSRVACSFSLLEKMFPKRIDLGLVAPSVSSSSNPGRGQTETTVKEIFQEFFDYYEEESGSVGLDTTSAPNLWHLTSSFKTFNTSRHSRTVNVSKALFHRHSNFDPELDEIARHKERCQQDPTCNSTISIAVGCYVSYDKRKITKYKNFYKTLLTAEVYNMYIIEPPASFLDRFKELISKYQTTDIVILNLGTSYQDKTECLEIISEILI